MTERIPKVSIGMPAYNSEQWISVAIDSLLEQDYSDFELIISDNASTDGTGEICRDYAARDTRIRYYRKPVNVGASDNYNAVFLSARGEYFKWASSNDFCDKKFLSSCASVLEKNPDVVLCCPKTRLFSDRLDTAEECMDNLNITAESACKRMVALIENLKLNNVMNGLIRSNALRQTTLIKPYYASDVVLMAELAMHGKFVEYPEFLFYRRMDSQTATKLKDEAEVIEHYYPARKKKMTFQTWKMHYGYLLAANRAPLRIRDKICIHKYILKQIMWDRHKLAGDVICAFKG